MLISKILLSSFIRRLCRIIINIFRSMHVSGQEEQTCCAWIRALR